MGDDVTGIDRFVTNLGDALERHAGCVEHSPPARSSRRPAVRRRLLPAAVALAAMAVVLATGVPGRDDTAPAPASAAQFLRASAVAAAAQPDRALGPAARWELVVDSWMQRSGPERMRIVVKRDGAFAFGFDHLSYRQLRALPTDTAAIARLLRRDARSQAASIPPEFDRRQARTYVLFTLIRDSFEAPTTPALRAALYRVASATPGLQIQTGASDHAGRRGTAISAVLRDARFVLVMDPKSGTLLETRRELLRPSRQFPGLRPGLISRATVVEARVLGPA